jgi:DNA-binding MarR family transcriptional regulator
MSTSDDAKQTRETSVGWVMQRLAKRLSEEMSSSLAPHDLTVAQFVVMMTVLETGGLSQIQIGRRFDLPAYATTRVLNALEERGFVERRASPTSRRAYSIYASDAGQKLAPDLFAIVQQVNADFMKPLPEEDHAEFRRMILQIMMG